MSGDVDFFLLREQERNKSLLVSIWGEPARLGQSTGPLHTRSKTVDGSHCL